jgi:hypothetical protein
MVYILKIAFIIILASFELPNSNAEKKLPSKVDSVNKTIEIPTVKTFTLTDTTVKFLWCANKYDEELQDTVNSIFINEDYCKSISDPERAALGFVATFIGNECWWDGETKDDRSNLKCKILTALNLGYQCSDTHLGFLRQWFRNDKESLEKLEDCPTTPYTSTIQDTFEKINLYVKGNIISVSFKAFGVHMREQKNWSWTETDYFEFDDDNIRLIKIDKSKVKNEHFEFEK